MEIRDVDTALHEAAHVVVGVALGLRLRRAVVRDCVVEGVHASGWAWFREGPRRREAVALMAGAGVAWDRWVGFPAYRARYDLADVRALASGKHGVETIITAAAAILAGRMRAHGRVTRALLERDIGPEDITALCRGE